MSKPSVTAKQFNRKIHNKTMPTTLSGADCGCSEAPDCLESICSNTADLHLTDGDNTPQKVCLATLPAPLATARRITAPNLITVESTNCFAVGQRFYLGCSIPFCETEQALPIYQVTTITPSTPTTPGVIAVTPPFPTTFTGTIDYTPQVAIAGCPQTETVSPPTLIGLSQIDWGMEVNYYTDISTDPVAFNVNNVVSGSSSFTILDDSYAQENFDKLNPGDLISVPASGISGTIVRVYKSNGRYVIEASASATVSKDCTVASVIHATNSGAFSIAKSGECWLMVPNTALLTKESAMDYSSCNGRPSRAAGRYAIYAKYLSLTGIVKRLVLSGNVRVMY